MPPENNDLISTPTPHAEPPAEQPTPAGAPKRLLTTPAAILIGAVCIALAVFFALRDSSAPVSPQKADAPEMPTSVDPKVVTIKPNDYVRGNKNASIVVFEYSDSDCPYCQKFHPTMQQIVKDSNEGVAWVYRYFPLKIHPNAYTEALALSCVATLGGNDSFWTYLDTVIGVTLNPDPESNKTLRTIATTQGINGDALTTCLKDPATTAKIDADSTEAQAIGARGTPFSIAVNMKTGKQVVIPGAYPIDAVKQMIDSIK